MAEQGERLSWRPLLPSSTSLHPKVPPQLSLWRSRDQRAGSKPGLKPPTPRESAYYLQLCCQLLCILENQSVLSMSHELMQTADKTRGKDGNTDEPPLPPRVKPASRMVGWPQCSEMEYLERKACKSTCQNTRLTGRKEGDLSVSRWFLCFFSTPAGELEFQQACIWLYTSGVPFQSHWEI